MSKRHLLVNVSVAALCSTILVLFTDIEHSLSRWQRCGAPSAGPSPAAKALRRQDRCR